MKKRLLSFALIVLLIFSTFSVPMVVSAEEYATEGTFGDGFTWSYDGKGTLTINGSGELILSDDDYFSFWRDIKKIVIGEGITSIGDYGLKFFDVPSIILPESLITIGDHAFEYCTYLNDIVIPNSVTSIGDGAFDCCLDLRYIIIPNSVTTIENSVFHLCNSLNVYFIGTKAQWYSISIGDDNAELLDADVIFLDGDIERIEIASLPSKLNYDVRESLNTSGLVVKGYYENGSSITLDDCTYEYDFSTEGTKTVTVSFFGVSATFEVNVKNIPDIIESGEYGSRITWTLDEYNVLTLNGSGTMPKIYIDREYAPWYDYRQNIKSVVINEGITSISNNAFEDCSVVTSVSIANSVKSISDYAFSECYRLKSVTIPEGVTSIETGAFYDCINLTDVYYSGSKMQWKNISIADDNTNLLNANIHYAKKEVESIEISSLPQKTEYDAGEILDLTGLVVNAHYDDGSKEEITEYEVSGFDSTPGIKNVTVSYEGKTVTFTVSVKRRTTGDWAVDGEFDYNNADVFTFPYTGKVVINGQVKFGDFSEEAVNQATYLLYENDGNAPSKDNILQIGQTTIDSSGKYKFDFVFDRFKYTSDKITEYKVLVNINGLPGNKTINTIKGYADWVSFDHIVTITNGKLNLSSVFNNLTGRAGLDYNLYIAFYSSEDKLVGLEKYDYTANGDKTENIKVSDVICPADAVKAKVLVWINEEIPITTAFEKDLTE